MDIICAFSSDSRELYKADIYRVLALPQGHTVHFRYKKKYVDDNLLRSEEQLKDQPAVVFFTSGNPIKGDEDNLANTSVRWASVTHCEISNETDVFHVYLKLKGFCNVSIDSGNPSEKQPRVKYFSKLACTEFREGERWQQRINILKGLLDPTTFFHIKGIYKGNSPIPLRYHNNGRSCHYDLTHGQRYILRMSLGNPDSSSTKIEISDSSEEITINSINPVETSVQFDDYDVPISVKTLQIMKQASLLTFKPTIDGNSLGEYATNIELYLNLGVRRPILFGFFSTLAFWALFLARPVSSSAIGPSSCTLVIAALLFWISTGLLYSIFNKK